jgi:hypothetical protein
MKKKILAAIMICFIAAIFTSCNRNNVVTPTPTPSQTIVGKWTMQSAAGHYIVQGDERRDTTWFTSADYFKFNADRTLNIMADNVAYNGKWYIQNNKLFISGTNYMDWYPSGFQLPTLTGHKLQLYDTDDTAGNYLEQTLTLVR